MKDEPAFPGNTIQLPDGVFYVPPCGLTKREYFSGLAMQGLISGCYAGPNAGFTVKGNCVAAVEYAEALIVELNNE